MDHTLSAIGWSDKLSVYVISNCRLRDTKKKIIKVPQPHLINLFNKNMGNADGDDQTFSHYIIIYSKKCIDL